MTEVRRPRRTRDDLRVQLIESALVEFAAKGFDGASTRSIAERVDAHQPQINYHFASKEALWDAAVEHLFSRLLDAVGDTVPIADIDDDTQAGLAFGDALRRFVRFAADHPELNRIMVHAGTDDNERLHRMLELHVRGWYETITITWSRLREAGIAAPIEATHVYWVIVGAASLPFVNAPEVRVLAATEPNTPTWVEHHADAIVATMLPGLASAQRASSTRERRSSRP
jgi:AcrR family transcriptional regulator